MTGWKYIFSHKNNRPSLRHLFCLRVVVKQSTVNVLLFVLNFVSDLWGATWKTKRRIVVICSKNCLAKKSSQDAFVFFLDTWLFSQFWIWCMECKDNETHCGFDFDRKPAHAFHFLESSKVSPIRKVHQHRPITNNNQQKSFRLYGRKIYRFMFPWIVFHNDILCREQSATRPVLVDVYSIISVNLCCFGSLVSTWIILSYFPIS